MDRATSRSEAICTTERTSSVSIMPRKITVTVLQAQLQALRRWGSKAPADLPQIHQPVLVANGDSDRMVPSANTLDLAWRLPNSELIIYPDSGHGAVFQFHADFAPKALAFLARRIS
jgi:pimeloyl-ACP methyl ester carboxylesterase